MGDTTRIAWCDSTINVWVGCSSPVGPGCDFCFAAAQDRRWGGGHFGPEGSLRLTSDANWRKPLRWNREAEAASVRRRVFCGSLMDVADRAARPEWRERLWDLIRITPWLDWQLLTKRPPNLRRMLPADWGGGYPNVWVGTTVEDRAHGLRRAALLREIPARVRFWSAEPLLEDLGGVDLKGCDWVVAGGESGPHHRVMDLQWVLNLQGRCREQGVAFFYKQRGGLHGGDCLLFGKEVKEWPDVG